jgi:transcriptional regulator with XRE-family HTH domain
MNRSEIFGTRLKELLVEAGLTQKELADRLNFDKSAVSNYVRGRVPSPDILKCLAGIFGVTVDYLLGQPPAHGTIDGLSREDNEILAEHPNLAREVAKAIRAGTPPETISKMLRASALMERLLKELE